jgi:hypothetical protein
MEIMWKEAILSYPRLYLQRSRETRTISAVTVDFPEYLMAISLAVVGRVNDD